MEKIKAFLRSAKSELNKITWPSKKQVWYSTLIVIFVTLLFAAYLGLLDFALTALFPKILG